MYIIHVCTDGEEKKLRRSRAPVARTQRSCVCGNYRAGQTGLIVSHMSLYIILLFYIPIIIILYRVWCAGAAVYVRRPPYVRVFIILYTRSRRCCCRLCRLRRYTTNSSRHHYNNINTYGEHNIIISVRDHDGP